MAATKTAKRGAPRAPVHRPGLHSRASALARLDRRTVEGRFVGEVEDALIEHLGCQPSAPERLLISATGLIVLRLSAATEKLAEDGETEAIDRHIAALVNSLRLNLQALGIKRPAAAAPSLQAYLTARAANGEAA
jgi:hypothetical protein